MDRYVPLLSPLAHEVSICVDTELGQQIIGINSKHTHPLVTVNTQTKLTSLEVIHRLNGKLADSEQYYLDADDTGNGAQTALLAVDN